MSCEKTMDTQLMRMTQNVHQSIQQSITQQSRLICNQNNMIQTLRNESSSLRQEIQEMKEEKIDDLARSKSHRSPKSFLDILPFELRQQIFGYLADAYETTDAMRPETWSSLVHCPVRLQVSRQFAREFGYAYYKREFMVILWPDKLKGNQTRECDRFFRMAGGEMLQEMWNLTVKVSWKHVILYPSCLASLWRHLDVWSLRPSTHAGVPVLEHLSTTISSTVYQNVLFDIKIRVKHPNPNIPPFCLKLTGIAWKAHADRPDGLEKQVREILPEDRVSKQIRNDFPKFFIGVYPRARNLFWRDLGKLLHI